MQLAALAYGAIRAVQFALAVEWRDIAWQANYEPLELAEQEMVAVSVTFDLAQYESLIRALLLAETDCLKVALPRVLLGRGDALLKAPSTRQ